MPNVVNYAELFDSQLKQKYQEGLATAGLTTANQGIRFTGANQIHIPYVVVKGYKDHSRQGGFNRQDVENKWMDKTLAFDRDVEMYMDVMDVDETNQVMAAANITNTFMTEQAIPETDAYRISKIYSEWTGLGKTPETTEITESNILTLFDNYMEKMNNSEVPMEGRIMYVTPSVSKILKNAAGISRTFDVQSGGSAINRNVYSLDGVTIVPVPPARMYTAYDFSDGFKPGVGAKQINMMLVQPQSIIAVDKHAYIRLWAPGTHTQGDGWLYQNRKYGDAFVIDTRVDGIIINRQA